MKTKDLAEAQIRKAQAEGTLDKLEGEGKPLPKRDPEDVVGIGMRIMAEAGVVPREIQLKKQIAEQLTVLKATTDPAARKVEMAKLADLQFHLAIEQEARRKFQRT